MLEDNECYQTIQNPHNTERAGSDASPQSQKLDTKEPISPVEKYSSADKQTPEEVFLKNGPDASSKLGTGESVGHSSGVKGLRQCENKAKAEHAKNAEQLGDKHISGRTTKLTTEAGSNQETTGLCERASLLRSSSGTTKNYLMRIGIQKKGRKLFQILNRSTKDCFICSNKCPQHDVIKRNLNKKYLTTRDSFNSKVINDIIYNENTHTVSVFKDFLIYDDTSEFLKRFYAGHESTQRLPKIYDFYDKYSQVFPNYVVLPENKFMFKHIERKQRVIDEQQKNVADNVKKKQPDKIENTSADNKILTTHFFEDIGRDDSKEAKMNESHLQSYMKLTGKKHSEHGLENLRLHELVDIYISKDSQSLINMSQALKSIDCHDTINDGIREEMKEEKPKELATHCRAKSEAMKQGFVGAQRNSKAMHTKGQLSNVNIAMRNIDSLKGMTLKPMPQPQHKEVWVTPGKKLPANKAPVFGLNTQQLKLGTVSCKAPAPVASRYSPVRARYATPLGGAPQLSYKIRERTKQTGDSGSGTISGGLTRSRPPSSLRSTPALNVGSAIGDRFCINTGQTAREDWPREKLKLLPSSNTVQPDLNKWNSTASLKPALPNMRIKKQPATEKRSTSVTNRNKALQMECLHDIYNGIHKDSMIKNKGRSQRGLIIETGTIAKPESPQKVVISIKTQRTAKPGSFKSNFLCTLQKKHQLQYPPLVPHAVIQKQIGQLQGFQKVPAAKGDGRRSLSSSRSTSNLKAKSGMQYLSKKTLPMPVTSRALYHNSNNMLNTKR